MYLIFWSGSGDYVFKIITYFIWNIHWSCIMMIINFYGTSNVDQKIAVCYISVHLTLSLICLQMCQIYLFKVYFQSNNQNFNRTGINSWEIKDFNIMKTHLFYLLFLSFFSSPVWFRVTAPNLIDYLSGKLNSTFNWFWFYLI